MKYKLTLLFIVSILFGYSASAQEVFKVLASKGNNKLTTSNGSSGVTIGKKLYKNDKITVAQGGYLGLAHSSGKTIELKTPGTYEVNKLSSEVASQNKGICKKYVDFVVGEMTAQDEDMAKNRYKYMAVTGSVERGLKRIRTYIPDKVDVLDEPVVVRWLPDSSIKQYVVTVTNLFEEVVYTDTVSSPLVKLDLPKYNLSKDKFLAVKITNLSQTAGTHPILLRSLPDDKEKAMESEINEVKKELGEETALNKFVLANVYAEKGLYVDAIDYFESAIQMAPEVEDYKIAYGQFLENKKLAEVKKK